MNEKVIVLHPLLTSFKAEEGENPRKFERNPVAALEEAVGLAHAINLEIVHTEIVRLKMVTPATLMGSGVVKRV